jgi:aminopeptidase N
VQAIGHFKTPEAAQELKPIALRDRSYFVESEAARSLGQTRQSAAYETLIEILDRPAWADILRVGALDGLAALRDERAIAHVLARTRYGTKTRGRRAAIVALARLTTDRKHREALEELLEDADPYLRIDVVRALVEMGDAKSRAALSRRLDREQDGRVRRRIREAFHEIGSRAKEIQAELRDEIDKLKTEQAELASKMKKFEATLSKSDRPTSKPAMTHDAPATDAAGLTRRDLGATMPAPMSALFLFAPRIGGRSHHRAPRSFELHLAGHAAHARPAGPSSDRRQRRTRHRRHGDG